MCTVYECLSTHKYIETCVCLRGCLCQRSYGHEKPVKKLEIDNASSRSLNINEQINHLFRKFKDIAWIKFSFFLIGIELQRHPLFGHAIVYVTVKQPIGCAQPLYTWFFSDDKFSDKMLQNCGHYVSCILTARNAIVCY